MFMIVAGMAFSMFFSLLILVLGYFFFGYGVFSRVKFMSYECGFDVCGMSRLGVSIRFFLLSVIFMIFDMEVCFILFLPKIFIYFNVYLLVFLLLLLLGVYYEWYDGSLDWVDY
uniref:NADH-ubiquinone oxidoreductase chain 3 n=1 Tax=Seison sp. MS-2015 TaxID=1673261 RepID=A0A678NGQ8_9BILA|nr:NADH dehydrogenase subunit 3 [Seison sp. MS-2015]